MQPSVGMVKRRAEHAEDTRRALVAAARDLFGTKGYAATSLDEVAERARVTKGALYHHFENKRELFRVVVDELRREVIERVRERLAASISHGDWSLAGDVWDRISLGFLAYLDIVSEDAAFQRIVVLEGPAVLGIETWLADAEEQYDGLAGRWLEEAASAGLIAPLPTTTLGRMLFAVSETASREVVRPGAVDGGADVRAVLQRILEGLRISR